MYANTIRVIARTRICETCPIVSQNGLRRESAVDRSPCQKFQQKNEQFMGDGNHMMKRSIRIAAIMASVVASFVGMPQHCSAGPLADWLSGRSPYYQPQRKQFRLPSWNSAPPARTTLPPPPTVFVPRAGATTPSPVYQAVPGSQQPPTYQPTVVPQPTYIPSPAPRSKCCGKLHSWCWPRRTYRSSWVRIPVTRYRTVIGTTQIAYGNPATQPCDGYAWQLRRVPTLCFNPFAGCWNRAPTAPPPVSYVGSPCIDPCAANGSVVPSTVAPNAPYYPGQPTLAPGSSASGSTTIVPSAGLGTGQPYLAPAPTAPVQGGTPADQRPSLNPNGISPNSTRSQMVPLPTDSPTVPPARGPAPVRGPSTARGSQSPGNGPQSDGTPLAGPRGTVEFAWDSPPTKRQPAAATSAFPSPARSSSPASASTPPDRIDPYFNVSPIRDPESKPFGPAVDRIPQLLTPDNHSADHDRSDRVRAWQVVPIKWQSSDRPDVQRAIVAMPPDAARRDSPNAVGHPALNHPTLSRPTANRPTANRPTANRPTAVSTGTSRRSPQPVFDDGGWQSAR